MIPVKIEHTELFIRDLYLDSRFENWYYSKKPFADVHCLQKYYFYSYKIPHYPTWLEEEKGDYAKIYLPTQKQTCFHTKIFKAQSCYWDNYPKLLDFK